MANADHRLGAGFDHPAARRRVELPSPLGTVASSVTAGVIDLLGVVGRGIKGAFGYLID